MSTTEVAISYELLLQARFAAEGAALCGAIDGVIEKAAKRAVRGNNGDVIARFRKIAMDGSVGEVLPFRLDSLDINIASVLLGGISTKGHEGIIFGIGSLVNAGFVIVRDNEIEYFDTWVEDSRTEPISNYSIAARLIPSNCQRFRAEVQGIGNFQPIAITADGGEPAIILQGANLADAVVSVRQDSFGCHVLDPFAGSSQRLLLSGIRVDRTADQNSLRLTPTKPEALIQLNAAHQQKRWMEVESGSFRALFAIPDISEDGYSCPAWVLRLIRDKDYVFSRHSVEINVPIEVAIKCCEAFRWFVIPATWEMARRLSTPNIEN